MERRHLMKLGLGLLLPPGLSTDTFVSHNVTSQLQIFNRATTFEQKLCSSLNQQASKQQKKLDSLVLKYTRCRYLLADVNKNTSNFSSFIVDERQKYVSELSWRILWCTLARKYRIRFASFSLFFLHRVAYFTFYF